MSEAFKRKRLSKRQIPTSSRRALRQEDPTAAGAAIANSPCVLVHDVGHQSSSSK